MNIKQFNTVFARAIYGIAILALVFSVTGSAYAQEPVPWLIAFPENDAVEGWEWPDGATVTLTINGATDPDWSGTAAVTTWGDPRTYVRIEFWEDYNLQVGDEVTLTDEFGTTVTHTVQNLSVTVVNGDTDTVTGTANNGATVQVWPHGFDQDYFIEYLVEDGTWVANFGELGFYQIEETGGRSQIVMDGNATAVDWNVPPLPPTPWRDEFDGPLADGWYWINENPGKWGFNDGFLRIDASPYGTGDENLLLRPIAEGDFSIETRLIFEPDTNFQFAGLVIWQDDGNFLQFGRAFCDIEGPCVGNGIYFDKVLEGSGDPTNFATQIENPFDPAEAYLRLERRGEMVRALYSHEGITWIEIGTHWIPSDFQVAGVGLTSSQDFYSGSAIPARFDYFELTEGWGFLPEGFHDYDSGDVPTWACNAGGWAVDPDNRDADIAVEVNVDGTSYFVNASEYREDLNYDGGCVDGSCGFFMPLWGIISSYETHNITAYGQDIESGEWVRLYNSPKELTCRTYDIYAYDPLTGETKQISNIRDADEYNPSFSPNGKKVAHDAVFADSSLNGIYITDVKTGVSTPLAGAGPGSNDAVWSPNGKWIVFDRAWDEDPSLYLVPPAGGTPIHVRSDTVSADWAPNGKRIVFQQPSDGSIRTAPVDGGGGIETMIAASGANPAWSPDGNWIAYENNGDIWKVQVNVQGTVFGDPIQVTSGPLNDGQPTWSPDSMTIVYHSGFNDDWDLWSVPSAGGTPTWLTGAVVFGDYDPSYAKNSPTVGYASFSPNGQAARTWVAAYTYDAGTWDEGTHTYQFWAEGAPSSEERSFDVSAANPLYDGMVLIRPGTLRAQAPEGCMNIDVIHPDQQTLFHVGWTFDGVYADARIYLENLNAQVRWDTTEPANMLMHEIFPLTGSVDWFGYTCTFTAP